MLGHTFKKAKHPFDTVFGDGQFIRPNGLRLEEQSAFNGLFEPLLNPCWIGWRIRRDGVKGFQLWPRRWVVERTFTWLGNYRRLRKDYEYWPQTSEAMIHVTMIDVMLRGLVPYPAKKISGVQLACN